jgi:hypothetical protein
MRRNSAGGSLINSCIITKDEREACQLTRTKVKQKKRLQLNNVFPKTILKQIAKTTTKVTVPSSTWKPSQQTQRL